jgi:hypothetical protein
MIQSESLAQNIVDYLYSGAKEQWPKLYKSLREHHSESFIIESEVEAVSHLFMASLALECRDLIYRYPPDELKDVRKNVIHQLALKFSNLSFDPRQEFISYEETLTGRNKIKEKLPFKLCYRLYDQLLNLQEDIPPGNQVNIITDFWIPNTLKLVSMGLWVNLEKLNDSKSIDRIISERKRSNIMHKIFNRFSLIVILVLCVGAAWFYWEELRPTKIIKDCTTQTKKNPYSKREENFKTCLRNNGLR